MSMLHKINYQLNKFPTVKKAIKRTYQLGMYGLSKKIRQEGQIVKLSPNDKFEYLFGYYNISPWDVQNRYVVFLRCVNAHKSVAPSEPAEITLLDMLTNKYIIVGRTHAWNVQQGCMLQWMGPDFDKQIIYNDFRDGRYCSVILNVHSNIERVLSLPIYAVANNGQTALTLDFSRLHRLRKGYGYSNIEEVTKLDKLPDAPCIWHMDLETGEARPLLHYIDFANFETRPEMRNAEHKVNHIMISPNGKRFMVLHRWLHGQKKYSRLVTCDLDGSGMYNVSDDNMISHCCWKNDYEILAFENKKNKGIGYYIMQDRTSNYERLWPDIIEDGHPSYSPNGEFVVTDTYPDKRRVSAIRVMDGGGIHTIVRVFAPFRYDNDMRCDLHPRWSRDGKWICFDAAFEGRRGLYMVPYEGKEL